MSRSDNPDLRPPSRDRRPGLPRAYSGPPGAVPRASGRRTLTGRDPFSLPPSYRLWARGRLRATSHGVGARIAPHADIIDVTHLVPPGDIRRGAAVLAQTVPYLPPAVHVAVVDPGVGTARRGVAVAAGDSVFIGPDNGLLSWAVARRAAPRARSA